MTPTEMALLKVALKYKKWYHDSNPDVGMGPMDDTLLRELLAEVERYIPKPMNISVDQWDDIISVIEDK
jgi:hypothetical protein